MSKILTVYDGYIIPTDFGFRKIIGKHFEDFAVDDYEVDEDGNERKVGEAILTHAEVRKAVHDFTGKSYDLCIYSWN